MFQVNKLELFSRCSVTIRWLIGWTVNQLVTSFQSQQNTVNSRSTPLNIFMHPTGKFISYTIAMTTFHSKDKIQLILEKRQSGSQLKFYETIHLSVCPQRQGQGQERRKEKEEGQGRVERTVSCVGSWRKQKRCWIRKGRECSWQGEWIVERQEACMECIAKSVRRLFMLTKR